MAESSLASSRRQLSGLLGQCEDLLGQLNRRQALLSEMRSLGGRIDEAYAAFESSPQTEADRLLLSQTQAKLQDSIESMRLKADAILAGWWDFHRAAGEGLVEVAQQVPAALGEAKGFKRLPTPNDAKPKLQLLRVRELLNRALQSCAAPESETTPEKPKRTRGQQGLMTAQEVALLCGISDKTVYRLASEGHIPYVKIQSNLRFNRRAIERWLQTKSFEPKAIRKAAPGK
jgi:excisionase family DNA binding protein